MAIGTAADMLIHPIGAMVVGSAAGIVSVLGVVYLTVIDIYIYLVFDDVKFSLFCNASKLKPFIRRKFGIRDLYGIHNLHGLPGLIAACVGAVAAAVATEKDYGYR